MSGESRPGAYSKVARGMRCQEAYKLRGFKVKAAGQVPAAEYLSESFVFNPGWQLLYQRLARQ